MEASKLEALSARLLQLREQLGAASLPSDAPLDQGNPLVQAARECEFMLPERLTVRTLADTVDKKIDTVKVLLARARKHEDLPEAAQVAAEQEYTMTKEDVVSRVEQEARSGSSPQR
jgi:hypothetical protein